MIDASLPLIDLHRHLEGSVRLETILDLGRQHNLPLPSFDLEELRPHVQVNEPQPGIMAFIARFEWAVGALADLEACRRIAYEFVEDAAAEGIEYIELRFSPWFMAEPHGLDAAGVSEAVVEGVAQGERDTGLKTKLIGILSRTYGPEIAHKELAALFTQRNHIVAMDLAGDEANFPGELFVEHFRQAREAGWRVTVHAGEAAGPESIWQAINGLGANRIGHATRILEDPALCDYLRERQIGIEVNLTSNVQTSTVPDYATHPLKRMLELDLLVNINTDDPAISGIDLAHEYNLAAPLAGLDARQIRQVQANAAEMAFLSPAEREELLKPRIG